MIHWPSIQSICSILSIPSSKNFSQFKKGPMRSLLEAYLLRSGIREETAVNLMHAIQADCPPGIKDLFPLARELGVPCPQIKPDPRVSDYQQFFLAMQVLLKDALATARFLGETG